MKSAIVTPIPKARNLKGPEAELLKNYRPVTNLPFCSKVLERVVADQLTQHMSEYQLHDPFQSAYKKLHGTETALVRVHNDILSNTDQGMVTVLVLLDLSAAFDTLDHGILLSRLKSHVGVTEATIDWFSSYLSNRRQTVVINGTSRTDCLQSDTPASYPLRYGVPQGSVLGPILFNIYLRPLGDVIRKHGLKCHFYADDSQLYISARPNSADVESQIDILEACCRDIRSWLSFNYLKLNDGKTDIIILGSPASLRKVPSVTVNIGAHNISSVAQVRTLGVNLESNMSMQCHIRAVSRTAMYHLHNISKIKRYLGNSATEQVIHMLVTSRLDYCNAVFAGLPASTLAPLQRVQNAAARLLTGTRKHEHITPMLMQLHWLPVRYRIIFKVCLLVFKCLHGQAPDYLRELLHIHKPVRTTRLSAEGSRLMCPRTKLASAGGRMFSAIGPQLWNNLSINLREAESLGTFKSGLKTHLFREAFSAV